MKRLICTLGLCVLALPAAAQDTAQDAAPEAAESASASFVDTKGTETGTATLTGAGRKVGSGRWGEATQVIRLPVSRIPAIQAWLETTPRLGPELTGLEPARPGPPLTRPLFTPPGSPPAFPRRRRTGITRVWTSMIC